ncbi:hypothetical protein [Merismopedia glauca]|uniref:VOC domain-containing protein n=1 Tax=Merismopedia glauca CCAP 1448/3 TaxID=1296344 RepID=A0A2T1C091_9CYAN|nr:hypothetical protein [Merismopedia glauca]PSB01689.1 hypothetical protein C7B64_17025 [Merismopedia glauca CCAP 1448/3]
MIHHISIAVDNPVKVAQVMAEIWKGAYFPFPPHPGSYIACADDTNGTAIEFYPAKTELVPGEVAVQFARGSSASQFTPFHAAISVPISQEQIKEIGKREGWKVLFCDRGPFDVIEFWVENKLMLELLPPAMAQKYLDFAQIDKFKQFFELEVPVAA